MKPPIIIIGAPRSGTNMLRDLICDIDGFTTWPCDEINYIWRYRNARSPTDSLHPNLATERVKQYIRSRFADIAGRDNGNIVVEKTCANCLRIPFVDAVFPDARYISITRDGIDAIASAMQRWHASIEWTYILKKARYVPFTDVPYYALRYLGNQLHRLTSRERRLAGWGPKYEGMAQALRENGLVEVCAEQWRTCVNTSTSELAKMQRHDVLDVCYEDIVRKDVATISRLADFLGTTSGQLTTTETYGLINDSSIGKGARSLDPKTLEFLNEFVGTTNREIGT